MKQTNQSPKIRNGTSPGTALWERINNFNPDAAGVTFPFSRKLARENNWSDCFTATAIAEYKKFMYLCCILPQGASPPYIVDQVWHMHLMYTENYWDLFCGQVLGRKLHHHPSSGGPEDRQKHEDWRTDTLEQYRLTFGTEPPPHIWGINRRPGKRHPSLLRHLFRKAILPLLLLLFLLPLSGCDSSGGILFFCFLVVMLFSLLIRVAHSATQQQQKKEEAQTGSSDGGGGGGGCSSGSCGSGCGGGCGGCGG